MDRTRQSLQNAIQANKEAQEAVRNELLKISKSKKRNRQTAASLQLKQANNCISMWEEDDSTAITNRPQWTRRFFVDADGNVPLPNEDSKRRVELEKDKDFIHQSPLWSKQEISHFYQFIHNLLHKEVQEEECDESTTVTPPENETKKEVDGVIDFEAVAAAMNEKFPTTHRTVDECRVKYQPNRTAFTKQESLNVLKQHHAHLNNTTDVATPFELSLPDTNRTKWQAFQALHSGALASDKKIPWTVQQDKVLFQTVAASGPQHVMDQHFAHSLSGVLQKHPKAILQRTTTSLLNPSFDNQQWSDTDERRLCLLMKVYRHSQYPFVSVASHFPNRGSRSVHDKWSRTLDPNYEFDKHFTQEEDARLSQLHGNTVDWKAQEQHFPGRLSQSLIKRWKELVSTEQLADDYSRNLKRKFKEFNQEDVVVRVKAKEP